MTDKQLIDKLLLEWSWRCQKGYPDISNEEDLKILRELLGQENYNLLFENENQYNPLQFRDLSKDQARITRLYNMIQKGEEFAMSSDKLLKLDFLDPNVEEAFKEGKTLEIKKAILGPVNKTKIFKGEDGREYSIGDLLKDSNFGGLGKGAGTRVEDANLRILSDSISDLVKQNNNNPILVQVKGQKPQEVVSANTVPGQPKSDFVLQNSKGDPVIFISHKKEGGPSKFIRWSGYTRYHNHPEVQKFNEALVKFLKENSLERLPPNTRFAYQLQDENFIRKLIYGKDYNSGEYSVHNVNIIIQGTVTLTEIESDTYTLSGEKVFIPPEIPQGDYSVYLCAHYRSTRNMFGIPTNEAIAMSRAVAFAASNVYLLKEAGFEKVK